MTFEKRVYEKEFHLNDTDDSIVDYIRQHKQEIQHSSIHRMAKDLFISPNSIMRLAKKLGYSGYAELKFSIQKEQTPKQMETVDHVILSKIPENITKTLDVIEDEAMLNLITSMHNAEKILFASVGDSTPLCEILYKYLRVVGKQVEFHPQIHDLEYSMKQYHKNDLIFFVSASGQTTRIVNMAKTAKEQGVPCVCVTHFGENPLSKLCQTQLCFWGETRLIDGYDVTDKSGLVLLLRMIAEEYWKSMA